MPQMKKLTAAYLAGLIDGEGYISLLPSVLKGRRYFNPVLKIGMTSRDLIEWFHKSFGGQLEHREYENPNFNDAYTVTLTGKSLKPFLQNILPFLRLKRRQAEICLEKIKVQQAHPGSPYTESENAQNELWYKEIRLLNQRGKDSAR